MPAGSDRLAGGARGGGGRPPRAIKNRPAKKRYRPVKRQGLRRAKPENSLRRRRKVRFPTSLTLTTRYSQSSQVAQKITKNPSKLALPPAEQAGTSPEAPSPDPGNPGSDTEFPASTPDRSPASTPSERSEEHTSELQSRPHLV